MSNRRRARHKADGKKYYIPNKILSMMDINGMIPLYIMIIGTRLGGKTFNIARWLVRRFLRHGEKFIIFKRFIVDLPNAARSFWSRIGPIEFPTHTISQKPLLGGNAQEFFIDGRPAGYIIALSEPTRIKDNSGMFCDVERAFLDEFVSQNNKYAPDEVNAMQTILVSLIRGGKSGRHVHEVPVYMCSNNCTLFNPYFLSLGVTPRYENKAKFIRGDRWVLEQCTNDEASNEVVNLLGSTITEKEKAYYTHNEALLDDAEWIEELPGEKVCMCKIVAHGKSYTLWGMSKRGLWLLSSKLKSDTPRVMALDNKSHGPGTVLITSSDPAWKVMKSAYLDGRMRFSDGGAKHAFLEVMCL